MDAKITVQFTPAQARALIGAFGPPLTITGADLADAVRALQVAVDAAQVAALGGGFDSVPITDADEAAVAIRACVDIESAAVLAYRGVGWQALLVLARRAGMRADRETAQSRDWCSRLARAVRS